MLLNPSHAITFSGLPPDVLETYVRYKKGTRAIVKWLCQHAPAETRDACLAAKSLPINDLAKLARIASVRASCMPEAVHFFFRDTIAARSSLSKYFRRQACGSVDSSTVNHEHFTSSLEEIYSTLCECCKQQTHWWKQTTGVSEHKKEAPSNHFSHLSIEDCSCGDEEHEPDSVVSCDSKIASNCSRPSSPVNTQLRLSGDHLSNAIETIGLVQQIQELYQASQEVWGRAGAGGVSVVVASVITHVAGASLRELEARLRVFHPAIDFPSLYKTCRLLQGQSSIDYETGPSSENHLSMLEDMHLSWEAVLAARCGMSAPARFACIHTPADPLCSKDFVKTLTEGVLHLASSGAAPDAVIRNGTPLYAEMGYLVTHPKETSNDLGTALSLHLLSTGYRAFMLGLESQSMVSSCRLAALKLSQQAQSSLSITLSDKAAFPCRCPDTISFHLDQLRQTLHRYTAHKCWNVFFQAPLVAGSHILEILDMCFYYGMRLVRYRHYVGSVIHSYNVLRLLAGMDEIPLLEELCNQFATAFFPGGQRPTSRFSASWARFIGARLKFKKSHKRCNHHGSWCMAVPSHAAKRAAGFGITNDGDTHIANDTGISEIIDLKRMHYRIDESTWDVICGWEDDKSHHKRGNKRSTASRSININSSHSTTAHSNHLHHLTSYLSRDLTNNPSLPTIRLNLFAIFSTCTTIVSQISHATHIDPNDKALRCICFAETILRGGDRIRDNEVVGRPDCWKKSDGERQVIEDAKRVIAEVMGGVKEKDWLWDI